MLYQTINVRNIDCTSIRHILGFNNSDCGKILGRRSLLWKMLSFDELPNSFDLLSIYSYSFSKARCVLSYLKYANFINKKRIKTANKWRAISLNNTRVMWTKSRHSGSIFHSAFQIINNMYLSYQKHKLVFPNKEWYVWNPDEIETQYWWNMANDRMDFVHLINLFYRKQHETCDI